MVALDDNITTSRVHWPKQQHVSIKTQRLKDARVSRMLQPVAEPRFEIGPNLIIYNLLLYYAEIKGSSQEKEALFRKHLRKQSGAPITRDLPFPSLRPKCPGMA